MKGVLERLVSDGHTRLAALAPIYGATEKLLDYLQNGKKVSTVTSRWRGGLLIKDSLDL